MKMLVITSGIFFILSSFMSGCEENIKATEDMKKSVYEKQEKQLPETFPFIEQDNDTEENKEPIMSSDGLTIVDNPSSMQVVVNKQRKLPDGYEPTDLVIPDVPFPFDPNDPKRQLRKEAAKALEELFKASQEIGLDLHAVSGYRSYERQKQIYEHNVATRGQEETDKFSAKPGTSEHQTGLAMDVSSAAEAFALEQTFKQTPEGQWIANNAHEYGFIIRYPEGKSAITGYSYEPWHLRYVGKNIASAIHEASLTLEEYFGLIP